MNPNDRHSPKERSGALNKYTKAVDRASKSLDYHTAKGIEAHDNEDESKTIYHNNAAANALLKKRTALRLKHAAARTPLQRPNTSQAELEKYSDANDYR